MPIITCPKCNIANRVPLEKEEIQGKCGRCGHQLPTFSLRHVFELNDHDFSSFLATYRDLLVLVDFYSHACGPCQAIAPVIAQLPRKFGPRLAVSKMDTGRNPITAGKFQIQGVPTLLFFRNIHKIDAIVGAPSVEALHRHIQRLL